MKEIKATMAGNVWKVTVEKGDAIESGEEVVILESMKMEIPIQSEHSGTVKEINVTEGQFVNEGDTLVTLK